MHLHYPAHDEHHTTTHQEIKHLSDNYFTQPTFQVNSDHTTSGIASHLQVKALVPHIDHSGYQSRKIESLAVKFDTEVHTLYIALVNVCTEDS